uniref:Uncharacterized protein n=1 Tax=Caenorhabditis japonica TaxID=281687 RepID=A0A8R1IWI4_CAEJA
MGVSRRTKNRWSNTRRRREAKPASHAFQPSFHVFCEPKGVCFNVKGEPKERGEGEQEEEEEEMPMFSVLEAKKKRKKNEKKNTSLFGPR